MEMESLISEVVRECYPAVNPVGIRFRRNWIVRTVESLPDALAIGQLQRQIQDRVNADIDAAYAEHVTTERLQDAKPLLLFVRLDDHHLLVRTEFADHEHTVGDAALTSQWGVLQRLDLVLRFEELQGLPAHWWFPISYAREAVRS